jgi:hypothetical protein
MTAQAFAAFGAGTFFMAVLLAIACFLVFRTDSRPIPKEAMLIFRVILALAGAAFAAILTGFLDVSGHLLGWSIRTGGGLAVFTTLYLINPPNLIKRNATKARKPVEINIPKDRIKQKNK